MNILRSWCINC